MDSCKVCLDLFNIAYSSARDVFSPGYMACKLEQRRRIKESAAKEDKGCQLCGKIFKFLKHYYGPEYDDQYAEYKLFTVFLHRSTLKSDMKRVDDGRCFSVISFDKKESILGHEDIWFSIWADEGMVLSLLLTHKQQLIFTRRIFNA